MIRTITSLFHRGDPAAEAEADLIAPTPGFAEKLQVLDRDPYLSLADTKLRLISVFDDLKYDRADMDLVSGPMRRRVVERLAPLGFKHVSGTVIAHKAEDIRMILPKIHALGASPFDASRYTPRRAQDYFVLTPTQAACQMIDHYPHEEAVEQIKGLVVKHPINLYRLLDYLERKEAHQAFRKAFRELEEIQQQAVASEPLRSRRALR